jgi:hypothetical protein
MSDADYGSQSTTEESALIKLRLKLVSALDKNEVRMALTKCIEKQDDYMEE